MTTPLPLQIVQAVAFAVPEVVEHLSDETKAAIKAAGYEGVRIVMRGEIFGAVFGYLSGSGYITTHKAAMATAVSRAYIETADIAYVDGGGSLPMDEDTAAWARGQLDAQLGFVDELFEHLREVRKSGSFDAGSIASARADGYASALDGFANEARLRGSKNMMVTWHLGATEKHCKTCAGLDGKRHKISWFVDRNYIPRKPGADLECGGWNCDCSLTDDQGNELTI
jgi:hypothetical protein